jgi:arylsulfatase A-like enzyme
MGLVAGGAAAAALPRRAAGRRDAAPPRKPNVLLILTDDQGYGDVGCHGNAKIRTPNLDRLAGQGVELTHFYVSPVCAPTRASLLTGRYNFRTGAIDTYLGRAMMYPDEITLAEMLADAGYRTGIFGKWHLGDNYPLRAMDQGFQESLVHKGGGIGQPSDLPGGKHYLDPVLLHNGRPEKQAGYCMDVYTDAALRFIEADRDRPFFAYLATNLPHGPLEVPDKYVEPYTAMGLEARVARLYGMIASIDENVGRLLERLKALGLEENTIVIFMTDNGAQDPRYAAGLRGLKGSVYDGGIRVPCFIRWPARLGAGRKMDRIAAHIDIVPTLLDACGVAPPEKVRIDGMDIMPLLDGRAGDWPDRTIYLQWHRGDEPICFRDAAARSDRWKLVMHLKGQAPAFELYDMVADPGETKDVAAEHADVVAKMCAGYEAWFRDVSATRGYAPPRIVLGTPHENPTTLTRQDWRGPQAGWAADSLGYWEVDVARAGNFSVTLRFAPVQKERQACFRLGAADMKQDLARGADACTFEPVALEPGKGRLEAWIESEGRSVGVQYVDVRRLD